MRQTNPVTPQLEALKSKVFRTMVGPTTFYGFDFKSSTNRTDHVFQCVDVMMLRWSISLMLHDRVKNETVHGLYRVRPIWDKMAECRLRWYGQRRDKQCKKHRSHGPQSHYPGTKSPRTPKAKNESTTRKRTCWSMESIWSIRPSMLRTEPGGGKDQT